ncbi:MAG: ATP-binding protein [Oligoflexia bacterium]|nr:ATP-binding protein [Oligoflexia bacterium]
MIDSVGVLAWIIGYMALLSLLAAFVERRKARTGKDLANHPWIYGLSLGVICTAWTYYGNVEVATRHGYLFMGIYLGNTLSAFFWKSFLLRMIRLKSAYRITSVPDLISSRYGESRSLGVLASLLLTVGIVPYIGLQILSIQNTAGLLTRGALTQYDGGFAAILLVLLISFTILFGLRKLDPTERHPGMVAALSVEVLIKLVALLACGLFVVLRFSGGWSGLFEGLESLKPLENVLREEQLRGGGIPSWIASILLGFCTCLLLPRQFHLAVVENNDERHIRTAQWLFPGYLFAINLFIVPIAAAGLLAGLSVAQADTFVLRLPMLAERPGLALFVFLGGFSASAGMVAVETMVIAALLSNHLLLPALNRFGPLRPLSRHLLQLRWLLAAIVILAGFAYAYGFRSSSELVRMGLPSFVAVAQLFPPVLAGLYWSHANRTGALLGLSAGILAWGYTLAVPIFVFFGWLPESLLTEGPFGISLLRPEALLGLSSLDTVTHSVFWSLSLNVIFLVGGSLLSSQSQREQLQAARFEEILGQPPEPREPVGLRPVIPQSEVRGAALRLFLRYFDARAATEKLDHAFARAGVAPDRNLSILDLSRLQNELQPALAGSIGVAAAREAVQSARFFSPAMERELSSIYASMLAELRMSPTELFERIDYWRLRKAEAERALEREKEAHAMAAQSLRLRDEFISVASHELKTPITPLKLQVQMIQKLANEGRLQDSQAAALLKQSERQIERIALLIENLLDVSRLTTGRMQLNAEALDLGGLVSEMIRQAELEHGSPGVFQADLDTGVTGSFDRTRLEQLVLNLLSNSFKFGAGKPISVRLRSREGKAILTVTDQGIGIAPEDQTRIFGRFEQAVSSRHYGGLGLGLYIARQIAEAHGGTIRVESVPGRGASFIVELPLRS